MRLMELNEPLDQVYLLKEELRQFWNIANQQTAEAFLLRWTVQAWATVNAHFERLADTLVDHWTGMLSYFSHRISTGPLEGLNNKIKVLKRQAYGFHDMAYFKLRLFFLHEATYPFTG